MTFKIQGIDHVQLAAPERDVKKKHVRFIGIYSDEKKFQSQRN